MVVVVEVVKVVVVVVIVATLANRELVLLPWWTMFLFIIKVRGPTHTPPSLKFHLPLPPYTFSCTCSCPCTCPQHLVPSPAFMRLSSAVGSNCSMDQFTGRKEA